MTERPWLIALVQLSDSFRASVAELARELRAGVVDVEARGGSDPAGWAAVL